MGPTSAKIFCFGFNGCGQLSLTCAGRNIVKPLEFIYPSSYCGELCQIVDSQFHECQVECRQNDTGFSLCPRRRLGGEKLQRSAELCNDAEVIDQSGISDLSYQLNSDALEYIHSTLTTTICAFEFGRSYGRFIMGCIGRRDHVCVPLSKVTGKSVKDACIHGDDLFCIDENGSCSAISLSVAVSSEYVEATSSSTCKCSTSLLETRTQHQSSKSAFDSASNWSVHHCTSLSASQNSCTTIINRCTCTCHQESNSSSDPTAGLRRRCRPADDVDFQRGDQMRRIDDKGWVKVITHGEVGSCSKETIFKKLASGGSHLVAIEGSADRPGKILKSEDGSYSFYPFLSLTGVKQVSCGKEHCLFLTHDGLVYSYGLGSRGQLGHGDTGKEDSPKLIEALACVSMKTISAGGWHSACVSEIGDLYIWGWNESGQLGFPSKRSLGTDGESSHPVTFQMVPAILDFPGGVNVSKVSCGSRHTAAVTYDKRLYTWGWGKYGQLGHCKTESTDCPKHVEYFYQSRLYVEDVKCGDWSTFVLTSPALDPLSITP